MFVMLKCGVNAAAALLKCKSQLCSLKEEEEKKRGENTERLQQKMLQRGARHAGIPTSLTEEGGGGMF